MHAMAESALKPNRYNTNVFFCRLTLELDRNYAPGNCTLAAGIVMVGVACVFKVPLECFESFDHS